VKRRVGVIAGAGLSLALIAFFAGRLDWVEFRRAMTDVAWGWVMLACLCFVASCTLRAVRWFSISGAQQGAFGVYWSATMLGYVGNALYPGRVGEVLRVAALHHSLRIRPGNIVATAFADRLADMVILSVATLIAIGTLTKSVSGDGIVRALAVLSLLPAAAFVLLISSGHRFQGLVETFARRLPGAWPERIPRWYAQFVHTSRALSRPRILSIALALTLVCFVADYAALWLILQAFGWNLPPQAAVAIGVMLALGTILPAAPGYVGIYQVACVIPLRLFGVSESSAIAYSLVAQGTTLSVYALLGALAAMRYGFHFGLPRKSE
jgi:uncharacterized protein (TIRG00374 family)